MPHTVERTWRMLATGLCFVCFGLVGLVLRVLVFPVLMFLIRDVARRGELAQDIIYAMFRLLVAVMVALRLITVEVIGQEKLKRPNLLILANHPSLIDVVLLIGMVGRATCIVKDALARNPFMRSSVRCAGYVRNESGAELVRACSEALQRGASLIIFPEGTRSTPGHPARLQRGAANVALAARRNVTPIRIECDPPMLLKGSKWYAVPKQRGHFRLTVCDDIAIEPFLAQDLSRAFAARRLTEQLGYIFFGGAAT